MFMRSLFLTIVFFLVVLRLQAQVPVSLNASKPLNNIGKATQYFKDAHFRSVDDVLQPTVQAQFQPYHEDMPNFGGLTDAVWLRFDVSKATEGDFYLQINAAFMDSLALYAVTNGQVKEVQWSGDNYVFSKRAVQVTTFLFPLNIRTGDTQAYLLRAKTMQPFYFLLRTGTLKAFMEDTHILDFKQGIYFGFMMLMVLYNLFLFSSTKDKLYLLYVAYVMSISWFMSSVYQYIFEYIWPNFPIFNQYAVASSGLTILTATLFTRRFLNTQQQTPRLHRISNLFLGLGIFVLVLVCTPFQIHALGLAQGSIMAMAIFFLVTGITIFYQGYQPAQFYLFAWSFLIIGFMAAILGDMGVLPVIPHINPMQIGSALEVALLSFALANRMKLYKKQREDAQNLLFMQTKENERILTHLNEILEGQVNERTAELQNSLGVIQEQSDKLTILMKELHHRVKNNLQIVSSLLNIQAYGLKDKDAVRALQESKHRVDAMSLIHQHLYQTDDSGHLDIKAYTTNICESLMYAYGYSHHNFSLTVEVPQLYFDIDKAIPIGLIINELVTNSFKYAYENVDKPALSVILTPDFPYTFNVIDNGNALTKADWERKTMSFGKQLILSLTQQINGKLTLHTESGTHFKITLSMMK
jgi:two-component sensor histidine kinase